MERSLTVFFFSRVSPRSEDGNPTILIVFMPATLRLVTATLTPPLVVIM